MATVAQSSGDARDSALSIRMRIVFQECSGAGIIPSEDVRKILATQPCQDDALVALVRRVLVDVHEGNQPLTSALVSSLLQKHAEPRAMHTTEQLEVLRAVAEHFQVGIREIEVYDRPKDIALARQVAMYLLGEMCRMPPRQIGKFLGGRDLTTVLYGQGAIEDRLGTDAALQLDIEEIKARIAKA